MNDLYDPGQLRTFLAVAQTRSFTRAAARLGVRQPTVSNHIRRLEEATGRQLLARDTHAVTLTPDGEAMVGFAGGILSAYTPAQRYFAGPQPRGRVRLGMSDDLALTKLPEILRAFRAEHPRIDIELIVDQSGSLHRRLERNHLDLFLGKRPIDGAPGVLVRRDRLMWIGTPGRPGAPPRPRRFVLSRPPSAGGRPVVAPGGGDRRAYRRACFGGGFTGLLPAVPAGTGIWAAAPSMIPASLVPLDGEHRLP